MPWIRIDDHFDEHPKLQRVGPVGWGFWLAGLAYCNRNLTDGFIPWTKARTLCSFELADEDGMLWELGRNSGYAGEEVTAEWVIGLLIDAGLWEEVQNGKGRIDGYRVHDYDKYQPSKEQVEADRAANAKRQADWRERNAKSNVDSNAVTNSASNGPVTSPPNPNPNPNPITKPKPKAEKKDDSPASPSRSSNQPFEALMALCEATGADVSAISTKTKSKQLGKAKQLLADGMSVEDVGREAGYLRSQEWRTDPIDMFTIERERGKWELAGKPATARGRASPGGDRLTPQQRKHQQLMAIANGESI